MPGIAPVTPGGPSSTVIDPPERRCWRCLQMFAGDPEYVPTRAEFWLCATCKPKLMGGSRQELPR